MAKKGSNMNVRFRIKGKLNKKKTKMYGIK